MRRCFDLAQRCGLPPVIGANTATREQTPETYLNQLLIVLRKAGLVCSVRGLQGSHVLACSPARIILAEAVVALEGSISPAEGLDAPAPSMTGSGASATQDSAARSSMAVLML